MSWSRCAGVVLVATTLLSPAFAHAEKADAAAAEALFNEGRKLLKGGQVDAACPKFEESYRLDPALGSLVNLALCHEQQGRIATAWAEYRDAEQTARRENDLKRATFAKQKAALLEPRLPKLRIVAEDPPEGLVVLRDGVELSGASLDVEMPVDPGIVEVEASAPGYETWTGEIAIDEKGQEVLQIPSLTKEPEPPPVAVPAADTGKKPEPEDDSTQTTLGWIALGTGAAGLVVGGVFTGLTAERKGFADDPARCPTPDQCTQEGIDAIDTATTYANVANVGFIAGAVFAATGVVLLLTADADDEPSAAASAGTASTVAPVISPHEAGLVFRRSF